MNERAAGSWSIAERATRWFALNTAIVALVIAAISAYFVRASVHRELENLVHEELDEITIAFEADEPQAYDSRHRAQFDALVQQLQGQHGANAMGWRVWDAAGGKLLDEFGARALLQDETPRASELEVTRVVDGHLWCRSTRLRGGYIVGVAIDGSAQLGHLRSFAWSGLILALVSGLITFLGGKLLIRRSCGYLQQVADGMRSQTSAATASGEPDAWHRIESAPQEINAIVDALGVMMKNVRAEQERARLLTAGLAHELGSPLQNLIGETEVALMGAKAPQEYRAVLESQLEELRDIGHAVGNLMTLVTIGQDGGQRMLEHFDLAGEAQMRLRRERSHAQRRGITLEVESSGELSFAGDREALWLAVSNLVANAIDYTPVGGRVRLSMHGDAAALRVVVDDSGPGVAEDQRDKIFEPFYRGPTTRGRRAGYGLGLSIARTAVDAHGGRITVENSPFDGARFVIELPRRPRAEH